MKRILSMIFIALMIGCSDNGDIEVIKFDEYYKDVQTLSAIKAKIISDEQAQVMEKELIELANNSDNEGEHFIFDAMIFVNEDGAIDKLLVLKSAGEKFDSGILEKMKGWRFNPFTENNNNAKFRMRYIVTFHRDENGQYNLMSSSIPLPQTVNGDKFYTATDEMPEPIGGIEAIQEKVIYPANAKKDKIEGRVFIKAYIDKEGNVVQTELIRGIGGGCNEAALEAVKATKFKPGRLDGKPVNVQVTVPILFKLK